MISHTRNNEQYSSITIFDWLLLESHIQIYACGVRAPI
jgi:hypothetical protein